MSVSDEVQNIESVRVAASSGRVRVIAGGSDFRVDGDAEVSVDGHRATVQSRSKPVTVYVPEGSDVVVGSSSGRVDVEGPAGAVAVTSKSGTVTVDHAQRIDARVSSGRVEVRRCDGECRVQANSGRVTIEHCGTADVSTTSGRIDLREADGQVLAHCVSGRIQIEMGGAHDADAETVSGRVEITYPRGVEYRTTHDGDHAPGETDACTVRARSVSGRVSVSNR